MDRETVAADSGYLRIEQFLPADAHQRVLDVALACESQFTDSQVYDDDAPDRLDPEFRRSRTLHQVDEGIWELFAAPLTALLPLVRTELGIPWFRLGTVERQLHVHRTGDFFSRHTDDGNGDVASRRVSAVYYFHEQPKRFEGGALRLYAGRDSATPTVVIEPLDNSLVLFPSSASHEVSPVMLKDDAFSAGRFSITFWFREQAGWSPTITTTA